MDMDGRAGRVAFSDKQRPLTTKDRKQAALNLAAGQEALVAISGDELQTRGVAVLVENGDHQLAVVSDVDVASGLDALAHQIRMIHQGRLCRGKDAPRFRPGLGVSPGVFLLAGLPVGVGSDF